MSNDQSESSVRPALARRWWRPWLVGIFGLIALLLAAVVYLLAWSPNLPQVTEQAIARGLSEPLPELVTGDTGFAQSNGVSIWYESLEPAGGAPAKGTVLLFMGIAADALVWPPEFIGALVDAGYRVIRHDHRGTGLSGWQRRTGDGRRYTLEDMADDGIAILDTLGIEKAHIVGLSMGGMIAQELALQHTERVQTLSLLMTSGHPSDPDLPSIAPGPGFELGRAWLKYALTGGEQNLIRLQIFTHALLAGSADHDIDLNYTAQQVLYNLRQRNGYNLSVPRHHLSAVRRSGSRLERLPGLTTPTLVLHGTLDPLIPMEHSEKLVRLIPDARGVWLENLGHDIPPNRAQDIAQLLLAHFPGN